ncbi:hypothetical protein ACOSP7_030326 [Xanthoceras sorbifolium]
MDTFFCNRVYEFLTRHESTFIQIQNTLQTIRDELQSLLFSQTQLATYLPIFLDDTYISAEVFIDFDKPPIFDDYVFKKVSYKNNLYFMDCFYESRISLTMQSTSSALCTILNRSNTKLKLSFPTFGDDDSHGWIFEGAQYVEFKHIQSPKFG